MPSRKTASIVILHIPTQKSRQQIQHVMNDGKPNFLFSVFTLDANLKTTDALIPAEYVQ